MPTSRFEPHSGRYLSFVEREEIAIRRASGNGVREIARHLDRSPSTISRELRRDAATRGGQLGYRATIAQWHRDRRAARPKKTKLAANERLREYVQERPEQIARRLPVDFPEPKVRAARLQARWPIVKPNPSHARSDSQDNEHSEDTPWEVAEPGSSIPAWTWKHGSTSLRAEA